ncbi:hypothetical protein BS47DRAFT_1338969 [Hydnum rufescens UP504]|uniref:Major facilitator superfamily (MFS) profile domain-containing protein n=1 Tax=Hydnum rufescens UP504 TaxID=1448309 RepID=A0A9P6E088_9AGAM|nr:hypothetical protein BS47DRAFT_1338969 [Hydnum rufescens UP504]
MSELEKSAPNVYVRPVLGSTRKAFMLAIFCFAEFMDAFIASALFPAINQMNSALKLGTNESTWIFAAYSATFAAFLLISGRIADIYGSKWCFLVGAALVGIFSLGCGFCDNKVALFVLRAMSGIGAAMTVPSGLSLIVEWFPDPVEQNRGIAFFGGAGAIGNVLGVVIGGFCVQWASWRWTFWVTTCMGVPIALITIPLVPASAPRPNKPSLRRLDLGGVSLITASIILFIFAVTSGSATGWGQAKVIAPLIISVFLASIDPHMAALPPRVWFYPNVPILAALGLIPFFWWVALFYSFMPLFEADYHWSAVSTSVHMLPAGTFSILVAGIASKLVEYVNPKWTILGGLTLDIIATFLLPFANSRERYWSYIFPAFAIGTMGNMIVYTNANIAIFMNTPPEIAGIVGAVFNCALQGAIALGVAILASIASSENAKQIAKGREPGYKGIADGFWFVLAFLLVEAIALLVFYRIPKASAGDEEKAASSASTVAVEVPEKKAQADGVS